MGFVLPEEAGMDAETKLQLAEIHRILAEIQQQLTTLAEQLGVTLD
jgi:hypothetical protein